MKRFISFSAFLLVFMSASAIAASWQSIGTRSVNPREATDTIQVSRGKSVYNKLQLSVRGGGLNIERMVVHFKSGKPYKVNMRNNIPKNGKSRVIDLPGQARAINKVVFWYSAQSLGRKNTMVTLLGQ